MFASAALRPAAHRALLTAFCLLPWASCPWAIAAEADTKPLNDKVKEIAGTAEFLRSVPKRFATLQAVDKAQNRVTLLIEGEKEAKVWTLAPDAELKLAG